MEKICKYFVDITYKTGGSGTETETFFIDSIEELNKLLNDFAKQAYRHKGISIKVIENV